MARTLTVEKKHLSLQTVTSTFVGMMMAVPFLFAAGSLPSASAAQEQTSTAQVNVADFAKFAYAYDQGYQASAVSTKTTAAGTATCSEASVKTEPAVLGEVTGATGWTAPAKAWGGGAGVGGGGYQAAAHTEPMAKLASMVNSYNTYSSMVYNTSSVTNTNSNNTVGSNNVTSTDLSLKVEDSKGVMVGMNVSNDPMASLVATNDSFNEDSYNTKTETSIVNDSFNKETNMAIDSGNTSTETTNVNKTEDSFNTETEDSNNTTSSSTEMNMTSEVNNTETKTIDSYNETDVEIEAAPEQHPHLSV